MKCTVVGGSVSGYLVCLAVSKNLPQLLRRMDNINDMKAQINYSDAVLNNSRGYLNQYKVVGFK
jgi:hypothetical protein